MPKHLAEKVVDQLHLEAHATTADVLQASLKAMQHLNTRSDREKVEAAIGEYRAGGLGVVGPEDTLDALIKGQVDELLIAGTLREMRPVPVGTAADSGSGMALAEPAVEPVAAGEAADAQPEVVRLADELVTKAKQTSARITFVEDAALLSEYGGVAALLRFRI
jgi:peptide subunit release factor 1 (eRF1)